MVHCYLSSITDNLIVLLDWIIILTDVFSSKSFKYVIDKNMHELSITQSILSIALEKANEVQASKVTEIKIVIGELSGIVDDCVEFYFDFLSKDTAAAQASLSFHHPPVKLQCRNCGAIFTPNGSGWACLDCQEQKVEIISGRECYVDSIEVD